MTLHPDLKLRFEHQRSSGWRFFSEPIQNRLDRLRKLKESILKHQNKICEAIRRDFQKAPQETELTEIFLVLDEINVALKNLEKWSQPKQVESPVTLAGTESWIRYEPKGVVLILAPWNYPFQLAMAPLVAAIAAGNSVILKPSEKTYATSHVISEIVSDVFSSDEALCILGDHTVAQALLRLPFDHIFFTGSTRVGRKVMAAAAEHLSSVTLELGGKCPALIDSKIALSLIAERLGWAKFMNADQTCVAPDYVLIPQDRVEELSLFVQKALSKLYVNKDDYCGLVDEDSAVRLENWLKEAVDSGARVLLGGRRQETRFEPTLITGVPPRCHLMQEEIFGPILPIVPYEKIEEALSIIRSKEKPLAIYVFSHSEEFKNRVIGATSSGGVVVNNAVIHLANLNLPFGGIGQSGMGSYHGEFGFRTFSHERAVLEQGRFNILQFLYPPYSAKKWIFSLLREYYK